jgi:Bacterial Ig domain/RTX calcium-binding nonapeptide repeat (4 copies)
MWRLAVTIAVVLSVPATARAADVSLDGRELRYTGAPGTVSNVTFVESPTGTVTIERINGDKDEFDTVTGGCTTLSPTSVRCVDVSTAVLSAGDMSDRLSAGFLDANDQFRGLTTVTATISGGEGNDALSGGAGNDKAIDGGPGDDDLDGFAGTDTLLGGDGNDTLRPNTGTDNMTGGDGFDVAVYGRRTSPTFSLDGLANDGAAGENDLIGADVEGIEATADDVSQTVTITGDGRNNRLRASFGKGAINGGEGSDFLEGGPQDDTITSRDGSNDFVVCNGGTDTVIADTIDTISPSCELIQSQASPGGPFDDRPPSVAWTAPAAAASLTANGATTLTVNATDDRGVARVQFLDDDRVVCEDATAPYSCAYQPRGGDVGRNTLIAVAVDGANQTTSVPRPVSVRRFDPRDLGITLRPGRDRRAPYSFRASGRLQRPDIVSPSQGCSGTVTLTAKRGTKTVSTKRARLSRTCEYQATFRFRSRTASRLRFRASFGGNDVLSTKTSRTRTARLG